MIIHPLRSMIFATRNYRAYITRFYCIITMIHHKFESIIQLSFIISGIGRRFMMHHYTHPLFMGIPLQFIYIEIRIGRSKTKLAIFSISRPVFPTFVPSLHQYGGKTMFGSKVNISFYIIGIGRMTPIRSQLAIIGHSRFCTIITAVCPIFPCPDKHLPPYTDIFHRLNPRCICISARLIQIQNQLTGKDIPCVITYYHCAPRREARGLQETFITVFIRY